MELLKFWILLMILIGMLSSCIPPPEVDEWVVEGNDIFLCKKSVKIDKLCTRFPKEEFTKALK